MLFISFSPRKKTCSVVMFLSDMSGREPLYKKAFVFFSSPIPKELVNHIKSDTSVLPRIGALREMNMEYFPIDNQAFITDHERALEDLFGNIGNSRKFDACLNTMATRIATVFASLKELPFVRYRAAKALDDPSEATSRDLVTTKLAAAVWNCVSKYKSTIPNFPQSETCELLILDRSVDLISPIIHEWTYDAMCHDLLDMDGNKYILEVPGKTSGSDKKEILLEDHDPIWLELRHAHIADASERLSDKMTNLSKNKAAQMQRKARDGSEISTRELQKVVQALPQYTEQVEKISLHVELAGKINKLIRELGLRDLGQLEQDLVFGDTGAKDVINFLRTKQDTSPENKLRLLMIYASVYPEKFEGDKATKLMQLARLSQEDMKVINNMRLLAGSEVKKTSSSSFSLKFDGQKKKQAARKDRTGEEETWQLFRFYPVIEELIEHISKGDLPKHDYSCMNEPSTTVREASKTENNHKVASHRSSQSTPAQPNPSTAPHSMRSRRTANWARARHSDDGSSSDSVLKYESLDLKKMGQRIFVFIIGGATRSELRVCHKLTTKLRREVVLGSSSIDDPPQFITKLKLLSETDMSMDGSEFKMFPPH
ncbi:protein transport Sec1a isoform X2 [Ziziphus jujuba]|uniref:Protein transport Sec1a isoform X2 n=1 Tax=Ziziphus jujuba TaxID=326968 RepID=A0A6P6FPW9_ZIZJJ|nr:protein transport Sec1a isoform X2 [Ziziphus jujuba]